MLSSYLFATCSNVCCTAKEMTSRTVVVVTYYDIYVHFELHNEMVPLYVLEYYLVSIASCLFYYY